MKSLKPDAAVGFVDLSPHQQLSGDLIVVDNSVMMRWLFNDGSAVDGRYARAILAELSAENRRAITPAIWPYEAGFVIDFYRKNGTITNDQAMQHITALFDLTTVVLDHTLPHQLMEWSVTEGVSTYDAGYLQLARQTGSPLATLDKKMRKVARRSNIRLIEAR